MDDFNSYDAILFPSDGIHQPAFLPNHVADSAFGSPGRPPSVVQLMTRYFSFLISHLDEADYSQFTALCQTTTRRIRLRRPACLIQRYIWTTYVIRILSPLNIEFLKLRF